MGYPPDNKTTDIKVLDHGYVTLIETWGADERIVEAARMSTGKGFLGWGDLGHHEKCHYFGELLTKKCEECLHAPGDEKLLKYLWENKHATPFEMAGLVIEVQAPIETFRQWHRHRTQSYNEMSARYTPLPDVNYIPSVERLMMVNSANRQAGTIKGAEELTEGTAKLFQAMLVTQYEQQETLYQWALKAGVSKELARIHLPVGRYSRMRAAANLRNWLAFLTLRMDEHAQWEIRQFANAVGVFIKEVYPRTWELFVRDVK